MYYEANNELYHHGILGQKWGVRRFQNEDGTLTDAGKARYLNSDGSLTKDGTKAFFDKNGNLTSAGKAYDKQLDGKAKEYNRNHQAELNAIKGSKSKMDQAKQTLEKKTDDYMESFKHDGERRKDLDSFLDEEYGFSEEFDWNEEGSKEWAADLIASAIATEYWPNMISSGGKELAGAFNAYHKSVADYVSAITKYATDGMQASFGNLEWGNGMALANKIIKAADNSNGFDGMKMLNSVKGNGSDIMMARLTDSDRAYEIAYEIAEDYISKAYGI